MRKQAVHVQVSDKSSRPFHENSCHPQRHQNHGIGPAYPLAAVTQDVRHLLPGKRGGVSLCHQAQGLLGFIGEDCERGDLRFCQFQQSTVNVSSSGGIPRGQHEQHGNHEAN